MSHPHHRRVGLLARSVNLPKLRNLLSVAVSCGALCALCAPSAHAQQVSFTLNGSVYSNTVLITVNGNTQNVYASPYWATVNGIQKMVFCVDVNDHSFFGQQYVPDVDISHDITDAAGPLYQAGNGGYYYNGGLASAITVADYGVSAPGLVTVTASQRASQVAWLASNYLSTPSSYLSYTVGENMTALSLALWDIIQDGGDGMGSGSFRSTSSLASLVSYYEGLASGHGTYTASNVVYVQASRNPNDVGSHFQDYLMIDDSNNVVTPVPEPGEMVTAAFMAGTTGLGIVRGAIRRRRRSPGALAS